MNSELYYLKVCFPNLFTLAKRLGKVTIHTANEFAIEIKSLLDYKFSENQIKEMIPIISNLSCRYATSLRNAFDKFIY